jgi:hypothetical protein
LHDLAAELQVQLISATAPPARPWSDPHSHAAESTIRMITFDNLDGDVVGFTEGDSPVLIDASLDAAILADEGFDGLTLTVGVTGNEVPGEDLLGIDASNPDVSFDEGLVEGGAVFVDGVLIGFVATEAGSPGETIGVTFTSDATSELVSKLLRVFTYDNINEDTPSALPRTVSYEITDGDGNVVASAAVTINVTEVLDVNDPPIVDLDNAADGVDGAIAYVEQAAATLLAPRATVSDPDSPTINGGSLIISVNGADAGDQLGIQNQGFGSGQIAVENGNALSEGGTIFATFAGGQNGQPLVITFLPDSSVSTASSTHLQALYRALTYRNSSDAPPPERTIVLTLNDGGGTANGGNDTAINTVVVSIAQVDDGPNSLDLNGAAAGTGAEISFNENDPAVRFAPVATYLDADTIESAVISVAFTSGAQVDDRLVVAATADITLDEGSLYYQNGFVGNVSGGTDPDTPLTIAFAAGATRAVIEATVRAIAFANGSDSPVAGNRTVTFTVTSGSDVTTAQAVVTVSDVPDSPVAVDDNLFVDEQTTLQGNVLGDNGNGGDFDPDGPPPQVIRVNGSALNVNQTITLASGATLRVNTDGTFQYQDNGVFGTLVDSASGAANAGASDSFTYTISGNQTATVTINVRGVSAPGEAYLGSASADAIYGTSSDQAFFLQQGGSDYVEGGGGSDGYYFGNALDSGDIVLDSAGVNDQVALQGDYSGGVTIDGNQFSGIEGFALLSGNDTRFGDAGVSNYDYAITLTGGWSGLTVVNGNSLRPGEDFSFNASATSSGSFALFGGLGAETWTGGQQSDGFFFGDGRFNPAVDRVNGSAGTDDQLGLRGDYAGQLVFAADTMTNIETIAVISATDARFGAAGSAFSYNIKTHDSSLAASARLTVSGAGLAANEVLTIDGSAETDGFFRLIGGAGADVLIGGAGNDQLFGGLGADALTGGTGADTFFYTLTTQSTAASRDTLSGFSSGDQIDLSAIDAIAVGGGANDTFTFIGANAFSGAAGQLRLSQSGAEWIVEADTDGDSVADLVIGIAATGGYVPVGGDIVL